MSSRHLVSLAALALLAACSTNPGSGGAPIPPKNDDVASRNNPAPAGGVVLTTLRFRDYDLRVLPGNSGPSFVVYDREGRILARADDEESLSRSQPAVYDMYRSAMAQGLDARVDRSPPQQESAEPAPAAAPPERDSTRRP